ncbi:alpha-1,3-arabinosyltransferase XAT3-like [Salvia miltiorrhiza]|uniref:alpha-1,3-arabinosyltransferase XAT3-like n=1 Tax=Salvia miltiorrhiza TaxID=226208 RepID=UPI0025AC5251|nr:alpha-1,3-arabinosyltransferase XAT3-like [Salvia miltiorrhiza]
MFSGSKMEPKHATMCRNSNYCEMEGDIRIQGKSSTIMLSSQSTQSWSVEPYPRKGTSRVKKWTIKLVPHVPNCTQHHTHPAILFSMGGFAGNYFHDFADILFPLYLTSSHFEGEAQFLATDQKPWWITKFRHILKKLTKRSILDIDGETSQVHCYSKMRIGLRFHRELITNNPASSPSMQDFRMLLREAYSLRRDGTGPTPRPRLMIVDRKRTRVLTNKRQVSKLARKMGFEVVAANMPGFAGAVNSCDVLVGVHGAGLTNMVFLPDRAVLIQVVPFGNVDGFGRLDFGNPASGMGLRYLEYKIGVEESSLSRKYSKDHQILRNPESYVKWEQVWSIYLNQQNVTLDLRRFKPTLAKALKLLRR